MRRSYNWRGIHAHSTNPVESNGLKMSFTSDMWWGVSLIVVMAVPLGWVAYWAGLFFGSILEGLFGEKYMKSWLSRGYREAKRQKPKDVWMMIAGGAILGAFYLIVLTYLIDLY